MTDVQELYATTISRLPTDERLRLAALILNELASGEERPPVRRSALALLDSLPGRRLFQTSAEADEYLRNERESWGR
jgi:hypothetical protein